MPTHPSAVQYPEPRNRVLALERHYTAKDLAELWALDESTIRRIFADVPGVLKIGVVHRAKKRGYVTLRIPESVAMRVHGERAK